MIDLHGPYQLTQRIRQENNNIYKKMNDPFDLPSLQEIKAMDQQRSKDIDSLEISEDHVKCQGCGSLHPIITDNTKTDQG
jgi:hypothetical protein